MKSFFLGPFVTALLVLASPVAALGQATICTPNCTTVCFTPGGQCTDMIVEQIELAQKTIDVQAYSFTSPAILQALVAAHRTGRDVRIILDKSQRTEKYSGLTFVQRAGIPVWIDSKVAIAHNKVVIIDGRTVITGSFNFTKSAQERNAENVLVIQDEEIAKSYASNWERRREASTLVPLPPPP